MRVTKDGGIHSGDVGRVFDKARFAEVRDKLAAQMVKTAEGIFKGCMNIEPKHIDEMHDSCTYCKYRGACRYERR